MGEPARGRCPACGKQLKLRHILFGDEFTTFRCQHCNVRLMKNTGPAAAGVVVGAFGALISFRVFHGASIFLAGFLILLGVMAVIAFTALEVRLATDEDPDDDGEELIRDTPPPLDPTFRGMSGPPTENTKP